MGRYKPRDIPCADCGTLVFKMPRWDRDILCLECATTRAILAAQQMAAKSGPAWDKWLATNGPRGKAPGPTEPKG